jgi:ribosomal protein S18 acetylase RimI-like enzyme
MSGQLLRIRKYRAADFEPICRIDRICFPKGIAFSRAELDSYIQDPQSITRVADEKSEILGFVLARIETPTLAHVVTLDVIPIAHRRGIGTSLMASLHQILMGMHIDTAVLEVAVGNHPARNLYEKMHYEYCGMLTGYYRGCEDAYKMTRPIFSKGFD